MSNMTEEEELEFIWELAIPKGKGWQQKDCPVVRSDKGDARRAWKQVGGRTTVKEVELAIQAQARFRRDSRKAGDFVPQPKMLGAWLRAEKWSDPIESHAELTQRTDKCWCGLPVHGPNHTECATHLGIGKDGRLKTRFAEELRTFAREHNVMKMTKPECVQFMKEKLSRFNKR